MGRRKSEEVAPTTTKVILKYSPSEKKLGVEHRTVGGSGSSGSIREPGDRAYVDNGRVEPYVAADAGPKRSTRSSAGISKRRQDPDNAFDDGSSEDEGSSDDTGSPASVAPLTPSAPIAVTVPSTPKRPRAGRSQAQLLTPDATPSGPPRPGNQNLLTNYFSPRAQGSAATPPLGSPFQQSPVLSRQVSGQEEPGPADSDHDDDEDGRVGKKRRMKRRILIDDEAEESDDVPANSTTTGTHGLDAVRDDGSTSDNVEAMAQEEGVHDSEEDDVDMDAYDSSDSFIDDRPLDADSVEDNERSSCEDSSEGDEAPLSVPVATVVARDVPTAVKADDTKIKKTAVRTPTAAVKQPARTPKSTSKVVATSAMQKQGVTQPVVRTGLAKRGPEPSAARGAGPTPRTGSAPALARPRPKQAKQSFTDFLPVTEEQVTEAKAMLQETFQCQDFPTVCEVTELELGDKHLRKEYKRLAKAIPLYKAKFSSWWELPPLPLMMLSLWGALCPDLEYELVMKLLGFTLLANFVNPSRTSPQEVYIKRMKGSSPRYQAYINDSERPAIFVTLVRVTDSFIFNTTKTGMVRHGIYALPHALEGERALNYFAMVFNQRHVSIPVKASVMEFTTRPKPKDNTTMGGTSSIVTTSRMRASTDGFSLDFSQPIPVFDATRHEFDPAQDLAHLTDVLPRWEGEVPEGSCVWVAYTTGMYKDREECNALAWNIQWAIVLGVPTVSGNAIGQSAGAGVNGDKESGGISAKAAGKRRAVKKKVAHT